MKTILITLLLACSMQVAAKDYIVVDWVRYQLHTEWQANAVKSLVYVKETIKINVL